MTFNESLTIAAIAILPSENDSHSGQFHCYEEQKKETALLGLGHRISELMAICNSS